MITQQVLIQIASSVNLSPLPDVGVTTNVFEKALTVAIRIIAAICVLFVVIGGFRYIISQGDAQGVAKAKGTVIYALIGLGIVIMAQAIIAFTTRLIR